MQRDLLILEVLCMLLIIFVQPLYSHPHNNNVIRQVFGARQMHAIDTPHFSHQLVTKRQASDVTANEQYCQIQDLDATCSSGSLQPFADAYLNCGYTYAALYNANFCAQNQMGEYCYTLYYKLDNVDPDLDYVDGNCSAALASDSCPSNCRVQLQLLKDKVGCCPFEYLNDSYLDRPVFDDALWNLCDIPLSTPPCITIADLLRTSDAEQFNCTDDLEEFFNQVYTQRLCLPEGVGQSYVSKILDNKRCLQVDDFNFTALFLFGYCSMNAQGEYCGLFDTNGTIYSTVNKINTHCTSKANVCNQICADTLMEAKHSLGCCINLYNNNSAFDREPYNIDSYQAAISHDLWNSCGVELPGTCESTLSLPPSGSKSLMQGGITIWVFAALMVFFQR